MSEMPILSHCESAGPVSALIRAGGRWRSLLSVGTAAAGRARNRARSERALAHIAGFHNLARPHHRHPIRERSDYRRIVRDEQYGQPIFALLAHGLSLSTLRLASGRRKQH